MTRASCPYGDGLAVLLLAEKLYPSHDLRSSPMCGKIVPTAQDRPPEKGTAMAWRILITRDHLNGKVYDSPSEDAFMYDSVEDRATNKHIDFPFSRAFKAYDDDNILYFSGRIEWDSNSGESAIPGDKYVGPNEDTLLDIHNHFAASYGVTSVRYHGKPGWIIG